ncbi:MAG: hypothetical protein QHH75_13590 [Bacillota bacterium]|nr:hypothetical protein [Bacillota bacterium]
MVRKRLLVILLTLSLIFCFAAPAMAQPLLGLRLNVPVLLKLNLVDLINLNTNLEVKLATTNDPSQLSQALVGLDLNLPVCLLVNLLGKSSGSPIQQH